MMLAFAASAKRGVLAALILVAALLIAGEANAHSSLIRTSPVDGAVLATAPSSFALTFSEPTSPISLKLIRPDGSTLGLDQFVLRDATLDILAPAELEKGTYVLTWRVVSEDGHPIGGSAVFSIGAPISAPASATAEPIDWPVRGAIWLTKWITYVALFLGVGGAFFLSWIGGRTAFLARLCAGWTFFGLFTVPVSVGLQGLDALGLPLGKLVQPVAWQTGFATSLGNLAMVAESALVAALIALLTRGIAGRLLSLFALVLVGVALASSGHASAAPPQWLTRPTVFLHGIGIGFWAGALIPLGVALTSRSPEAGQVLRRFSKFAPWFVLPLIGAGLLLALVQVRQFGALWTTDYGNVLLAKLALLAPLFALAFINRIWLTDPAERGDARANARLRRSISLEMLLVVTIFAVAGLWRFTPPPRALAEAAAAPISIHIHAAKAMADLDITPGRAGPVRASIVVMTGDFGTLDAKEVSLVLSNPDAGIEPMRRPAQKSGDGSWRIEDMTLPVPGRWKARIDILISDFELVKLEESLDIRP